MPSDFATSKPSSIFRPAFLRQLGRFNDGLDWLLYIFSTYAVPIVIALLSVVAMLAGMASPSTLAPQALGIKVLQNVNAPTGPSEAVGLLQTRKPSGYFDTHLLEAQVWLSFVVPPSHNTIPWSVEFPSRHTLNIACWDAQTLKSLGAGNRTHTSGDVSAVKAGYALKIGITETGMQVLCATDSVGPARLSAVLWPSPDLQLSAQEFHRKSGLLDGGLLILAGFVLVAAMINRSGLYMLFAAWLVINLRMGALSSGWDAQWLGSALPQDWLLRTRLVTTGLYYVLSVTLFKALFQNDLKQVGSLAPLRAAQWSCLPLFLLSCFLSYATYLPILWVTTAFSIAVMVYFLARILWVTRSTVAMWYGASVSVAIVASLYEVIAAALGAKELIGSVNSVTAALSSSLLAALAIAAQMRVEHHERLALQAELKHTFDAMPIGMFTLDLQGRFLSANPALLRMLGPSVLENEGGSWQQHFDVGSWPLLHQLVHSQMDGELEIKGKSPRLLEGEICRFLVKATLARDRIEGSLQNITEKSRAIEDLRFLANNDPLTKVLNRRGIEKALDAAMADLAGGKPLALAYLDLDRFRLINDLYGHNAGDEVLQQVCERVSHLISGSVQFGRVGGDEFVLLMPDTRIPTAALICRGIVDSLGNTPYRVGERAFHVRGSMGLIEVSTGMRVKDAVSSADRACHEAKASNGNGLVVYERNAAAFDRHDAELKLVEQLSTTSATDGLFLVMQPIMSLNAPYESLNFEVLLRMNDENGKLIPTDRLITAGENSGRMGVIDRWVLSTTLAWLNQNHAKLKTTRFVCMNLNGASLNDEKFLQDVYTMLERNLHIVKLLCLEITESVALHDLDNTRRFVDKVRSYGAKVALDDFGAGYTSFSYLKELTADLLKIDGSFIVNMNEHPANISIVEAIVSLARNLGMKTIAEWAEDAATVQTLIDIGVDYVQGFVVARPQPPALLLTATSSASFIRDDELLNLLATLDPFHASLTQVDLFDQMKGQNLH